jgi:3-oxoacyl-[acyl-carrier protein] reductase
MSLECKTALVTGAGHGIGAAIARLLSERGATVACNDLTESCIRSAEQIENSGGKAVGLQFDVAVSSQVNTAVSKLIERLGKVDILINNAGGSAGQALVHDMKEEIWQRTLDVNLRGCFNCSKALLPAMIKNHYGKIVSIASIRAETGLERDAAYAAAKAGIYGFSRSLAREVAQYGINVNVVSPGIIRTGHTAVLPWEDYVKIVPLGIGKPEDVAYAVAFLCSDEARYITGQVLHVNGGWWPSYR